MNFEMKILMQMFVQEMQRAEEGGKKSVQRQRFARW